MAPPINSINRFLCSPTHFSLYIHLLSHTHSVLGRWGVVREARAGAVRPGSVLVRSSDATPLLPKTSFGRFNDDGVRSVVSLSPFS